MLAAEAVRVAVLQLQSGADVSRNLDAIDGLLADAAGRGAAMAFLPENLAIMGVHDEDKLAHAEEPGEGPIQSFLGDRARHYGIWLVAGSIPLRSADPGRCFGASLVFDSAGEASRAYRKIHLFDVDLPDRDERYRESDTMAAGDDFVLVPSPIGLLGLSICYDLRFPELYRRLVEQGASAFSVPAAFTATTGEAHWHALLRARAIENLAWVVAAAQHGTHPSGRRTFGHSMIVDPWGRVIAELAAGNGVADAVIDPGLPLRLREEFPVLRHRRIGRGPHAIG